MKRLSLRPRGGHRRTPETWARMVADLAEANAKVEAMRQRLDQVAVADAQITALVAERDALVLRVAELVQQLHSDATVTQELPMPGMAQAVPIKAGRVRFEAFMQGANAARTVA